MKIYKKTVKSHSFNEDRFVISKKLFGVLDGATDLSYKPSKRVCSEASKLVATLKQTLEKFKGGDVCAFLKELSENFFEENLYLTASCGISLMQIDGERVNFYGLGDTEILVKYKNGKTERIKQKDLEKLDKIAIEEMVDYIKANGVSHKIAREYINPTLIKHRNLMNKPNGYNVFQPLKKATFEILIKSVNKQEIESVILCTDGFAQAFTTLNVVNDYKELFNMSQEQVLEQVISVSNSDENCSLYPRFKKIDDITVIKIDF